MFMNQSDLTKQSAPAMGRLLVAFVVGAIMLVGCSRTNETGDPVADDRYRMGEPIEDSTYALIIESQYGGDTLTTERFLAQIQNFMRQVPGAFLAEEQRIQLHRGIAEEFIRRHFVGKEAQRLGLEADSADVESQLNGIRSQFPSAEAFEGALAAQNMTLDSLRSAIVAEVRLQMMTEQMTETATEPTSEEIEDYRNEQAEEVQAQHILFRMPDPEMEAEVMAKARAVLDSAKAGVDFAELARRHSEGPSGPQGGDLGFFSRTTMVAPFSKAAFALSDSGDVAPDLVKTQFGYHIIRLTGRRTVALMDTAQAQEIMMQERRQTAYEEAYKQLREEAVIRLNEAIVGVDLNSSSRG
ncbi:MAG: peptidylprolyl isomerase [Rhodothermales bacterium]